MVEIDDPDLKQLFGHSKRYDQGMGKIRTGAGVCVVAKDGSGDYDNITEAIKDLNFIEYLVKEGTYSGALAITRNLTLRGNGRSTIITGDITITGSIPLGNSIRVTIENFEINGNITLTTTRDVVIRHNFLEGAKKLYASDTENLTIENNFFNIYLDTATIQCNDTRYVIINSNYFAQCGTIDISEGDVNKIINNTMNDSGNIILSIETNTHIMNNYTNSALTIDGDCSGCRILGNVFTSITDSGNSEVSHNSV